jgi:hypothetical protein
VARKRLKFAPNQGRNHITKGAKTAAFQSDSNALQTALVLGFGDGILRTALMAGTAIPDDDSSTM